VAAVELDPEALRELEAAADRLAGSMAQRLRDEVARVGLAIGDKPRIYPFWPGLHELGVRRIVLRRLPYSIAYLVEQDTVWIVAVAHHRRAPGYFLPRVARRRRTR